MKRYFLLSVAAVAALASCQKNEGPAVEINQDSAIGFSAYTSSPVTKGTIVTGTNLDDPNAELNEIGVFAFYQQNANGNPVNFNTHKFACPDYMYNQKVKNVDNTDWLYSPVKYWPNTPGDQLSFFAYAPYSADKNWEELGIVTDAVGKKMTVSFPIYSVKSDMVDYLWATPQINKKNASTVETGGYKVADKVSFEFKHITSQISLYIGAEKEATAKTPSIWSTDTETEITVDNIMFKGLAESMTYTYTIPEIASTDPVLSVNGKQDIVLSSSDFSEMKSSKNWDETAFKKLLAEEKNAKGEDEDGFLFFAPQTVGDLEIVFTYTVKTTDSANAANSSTITNTITRKWSDFANDVLSDNKLEAGKAYKLNILIGMNTVDFTFSETVWETATTHNVDIPANK